MFAAIRKRLGQLRARHAPEIAALVAVSTVALGWIMWSSLISKEPRITIIDVGQGNSALVETVHHQTILVDGGPSEAVVATLGTVLGPFRRRIDVVVLTNPFSENLTGLSAVLQRYNVGTIVDNHWRYLSAPYQRHRDALAAYPNSAIVPLTSGQRIEIDGITLTALWPSAEVLASPIPAQGLEGSGGVKDQSLVLRINATGKSMLLMSGVSVAVEQELLKHRAVAAADVLVVGDHGSRFSTSQELLDAAHPSIAVISVGAKNLYNHPAQSVIHRLQQAGARVLSTSKHGTVRLTFSDTIRITTDR